MKMHVSIKKGFTLTELMITVATVGVLVMIAIPQYGNYIAKAQVTEGIQVLSLAKNIVIEQYSETGQFMSTEELQILMPQSKSNKLKDTKYLNLITTNQSGNKKYYDINLRLKKDGLNSRIANKHLTYRYNYATKQWTCVSEDILQAYLPSVCQGIGGNNKEDKDKSNNGNHYGQIKNGN